MNKVILIGLLTREVASTLRICRPSSISIADTYRLRRISSPELCKLAPQQEI